MMFCLSVTLLVLSEVITTCNHSEDNECRILRNRDREGVDIQCVQSTPV